MRCLWGLRKLQAMTWKDHKSLVRDNRIETLKDPNYYDFRSDLLGGSYESKEDELKRLEKERDEEMTKHDEGNPS